MSASRGKQSYPYVPWFHGDFLRSTVGWTLTEKAAYWLLLCAQWDLGALPNDHVRLASIIGIDSAQMAAIWPLISQKFPQSPDGRLVNTRMEEHRARIERYRKSLSEAGRKGMKTRWKDKHAAEPEWLSTFKNVYPARAGDQGWSAAVKNGNARIAEGYTPEQFIAGARRYALYCASLDKTGTEYVKKAATFLDDDKGFLEAWPVPVASQPEPRRELPDAFEVARGRPKVVV